MSMDTFEGHPPIVWPWSIEELGNGKLIYDVTGANCWIVEASDLPMPVLVVTADGLVDTTGWTNLRLVQRPYESVPSDGFLDIDFVGDPPPKFFAVLTFSKSVEAIVQPPPWLKGVRIHALNGTVASRLSDGFSKPQDAGTDAQVLIDFSKKIDRQEPRLVSPLWRKEVLSWKDPTTLPHTRTECVKWAHPWPHSKICIGNKYQFQYLYGHLWLTITLNKPEDIEAEIDASLRDAAVVASASAILEVVATGGVTLANAIAAFGETFKVSLASRIAGSLVSVDARNSPSWGNYE